jgi:hypothetical protein
MHFAVAPVLSAAPARAWPSARGMELFPLSATTPLLERPRTHPVGPAASVVVAVRRMDRPLSGDEHRSS